MVLHGGGGGVVDYPSPPGQTVIQGKPLGPSSPWEEFGWFDQPKITAVTIAATTIKQLIGKDPRRVVLILSNGTDTTAAVNVSPNDQTGSGGGLAANSAEGWRLDTSNPYLYVPQASWGNLAQWEWWGKNQAAGNQATVTVIELFLKGWPSEVGAGQVALTTEELLRQILQEQRALRALLESIYR